MSPQLEGELLDEIERLRAALEEIVDIEERCDRGEAKVATIARRALNEEDTK